MSYFERVKQFDIDKVWNDIETDIDYKKCVDKVKEVIEINGYNLVCDIVDESLKYACRDYNPDVYLMGGIPAKPVVEVITGKRMDLSKTDLDFLVDDSGGCDIDFVVIKNYLDSIRLYWKDGSLRRGSHEFNQQKVRFNRFGSLKWLPIEGVEVDIVPFSNFMTKNEKDRKEKMNVEKLLSGFDFDTGAIVYDLNKEKIVAHSQTFRAYRDKKIGLLHVKDDSHVVMARLVLQAKKFGFGLRDSAINYIRYTYDSSIHRQKIAEYLNYKNFISSHDCEDYYYVIDKIESLVAVK